MKKILKSVSAVLSAVIVFTAIMVVVSNGKSKILSYDEFCGKNYTEDDIQLLSTEIDEMITIAENKTSAVTENVDNGFLMATGIKADGVTDVSDDIQKLIDENPNRTIYFPDGIYLLSKPVSTPAKPSKSVDLKLSTYAVFRATKNFEGNAIVRLGGKDPANDTRSIGSVYGIAGGIIDCQSVTNAISIESGRHTRIADVSIKNSVVGIHVFHGANSGSSDCDINNVNIIGTGKTNSIGVLLEGYDNTLSNLRIDNVFIGMHIKSAGNSFKNIHPLYYSDYTDYENSCAFLDECGSNLYDYCYSDQFSNGFKTVGNKCNVYSDCFAYWYSTKGERQVCFKAEGEFKSVVTNFRAGVSDEVYNAVLEEDKLGTGTFDNIIVDSKDVKNKTYKLHLNGGIIWLFRNLFK